MLFRSLTPVKVPPVHTKWRTIKTALPVPESLPVFELLRQSEPRSMSGQPPVVWDHAKGSIISDRWGNRWIDWSSGVLVTNAGHGHPRIVAALREAIDRPLLATYVFPHEGRARLTSMLSKLAPNPDRSTVFLLSTGSEATENCIKLAKTYALEKHGPAKSIMVTFNNAFHGRTMGAQLAGGMAKGKRWLGTCCPQFVQVPFPDGYKNPDTSFDLFLSSLKQRGIGPDRIAGVMTESYQGVGPDFLPVEYARKLEAWCRQHDIVLVMDEVQAGFGRTGKMFCFEHYGVAPDLIACGKGISSSLPLSAVIGRSDVKWGECPLLLVELREGAKISDEELLGSLKDRVASWWIPDAVVRVPAIPLAATGKIDKLTLSIDRPKLTPEEIARAKEETFQAKERRASETAPTSKTEMGRRFAKGGYVRAADGIAKRGKTRGKLV